MSNILPSHTCMLHIVLLYYSTVTTAPLHLHREISEGVVSKLPLVCGGDQEGAEAPGAVLGRAVLLPNNLPTLPLLTQHHQTGRLLLPHHTPEVDESAGQWGCSGWGEREGQ